MKTGDPVWRRFTAFLTNPGILHPASRVWKLFFGVFSRVKSECGSNMNIILDIIDMISTLLSQCYKQNSISVYYLRQKLSFYLGRLCFGQSVHKKKILCHLIFIPMHPFLLCFTAFITRLHGVFEKTAFMSF